MRSLRQRTWSRGRSTWALECECRAVPDVDGGGAMRYFVPVVAAIGVIGAAACSVAPYEFPDNPPRHDLVATDATRIVVKQEFRYSPTLTSIVFPTGEYLPVRADSGGTYYESPRGLLILPVAGQGFLVRGGIYRRSSVPERGYEFNAYGEFGTQPLHSMLGLNLNERINCTPSCSFR